MIPFRPWHPDKGPFSATSTDRVMNVIPLSNGYGPFKDLSEISDDLGAPCFGAVFYRSSDGSFGLIAGTQTELFKYNTADGSWTDVSGSSAPYSVPDGQFWQFERFGNYLYATNLDDVLQRYDVDTGSAFEDVPGSPPQAKYIKAIGDFLFLAYLKIGADEFPQSWRHCGLNDAETWSVGTKKADGQLIADGDEIMGIISVPGGGRVFQRNAIRALIFTPDSQFAFRMDDVDATRGVIAPYSVVPLSRGDYVYLGEDGFYRGDQGDKIGLEKVNRTFFAIADLDSLDVMQGVVDPYERIVWWTYLDGSATRRMIGYDPDLNEFVPSNVEAVILISAVTAGYTLEDLDAFGTLDALPASLDSRVWKGGRPTFGAFKADGKMYTFTGPNAAAEIATCQMELVGGARAWLSGARHVSDSDNYTLTVLTADFHGGTETAGSAVSPNAATGMTPFRRSGRLHRFVSSIAAGDVWTHAHGIDVEGFVRAEGQR